MKLGRAINYDIIIAPSDNQGFKVKVGCGKFVFGDKASLMKALEEYLKDPQKWEEEYNKIAPDRPRPQQPMEDTETGGS